MATKSNPDGPNQKEYERLGREIEALIKADYTRLLSTPRQIWSSLLRGTFAGLGGVLGATVGVGLLVFLLQHFGGVPYIGHFFNNVAEAIRSGGRP